MKKAIYNILSLALTVVLLFNGCSKLEDFGDTNVNPAVTTKPSTAALLTNVLSGIGGYAYIARPALYCQFFSETQYTDASRYADNMADPSGAYAGVLYDLQNIIIYNTDEDKKVEASLNGANENQIAIARILKSYIIWTITDRWGDVPYTDALKGDPNVTFDTQETIYKGLIKELTEAVAQFTTSGGPIKGDVAYNGDIAKWKKLANSLRMLMALRLSKVYPGAGEYAAAEFKAALADAAGHISTNENNFIIAYPGGNFKHPAYNMYDGRKDYGESKTMTDIMTTVGGGDPRQAVYGATVTGLYSEKGVPYGWIRSDAEAWTAANPDWCYVLHPDYRKMNSPIYVVDASHVLLARAEAADRGWTTETPNTGTLYEAGIKASFAKWGLAGPTPGYLNHTTVKLPNPPGSGANLSYIHLQQYLAYYPDGLQGWSHWRRTDVPTLTPARDAVNTPPTIPRRYKYHTTNYSLNGDAVNAAVARLTGGDKMESRIWWDK
ncbi:MAG: SusD/RagB family nutrient-binding outer membrane lipoprotein [Bacteroidales bacterium]